jgi:hypothetical protein
LFGDFCCHLFGQSGGHIVTHRCGNSWRQLILPKSKSKSKEEAESKNMKMRMENRRRRRRKESEGEREKGERRENKREKKRTYGKSFSNDRNEHLCESWW